MIATCATCRKMFETTAEDACDPGTLCPACYRKRNSPSPAPGSPEARIAAMQKRVADEAQRQKDAKDLAERRNAAGYALAASLQNRLHPMNGLPCLISHRLTKGECEVMQWPLSDGHGTHLVVVSVKGDNKSLMQFTVSVKADASDAWIEHDDTRISEDTAVDLAVAAVEAVLCPGDPPPLPPAGHSDDDIPF
jgi:hypothetical protein